MDKSDAPGLFPRVGLSAGGDDVFRDLIEAAPDAVVVADSAGLIVLVNAQAERMFGWPRRELLGEPVEALIPERYAARHHEHRRRYGAAPRMRQMGTGLELRARRRDGAEFPVEVSLSPLRVDGAVLAIATVRDVSDRKRFEAELAARAEALARSNEELERFAYVASHDLQEPLRTVASYTQLLERRCRDRLDEPGREYIAFIVEAARRMHGLIQDLLAYSRVGRQVGDLRPASMDEAMREALANLRGAIAESGAEVGAEALPVVTGDRAQLVHLLQNLIGNAIKFRVPERPPRIHVGARRVPDGWEFRVRDNGIGIDPAYFDKLFVIFQRLHTRDEFPGSGVGLAICNKIVARHGGRIWVESEPGAGSTFFFTLPA